MIDKLSKKISLIVVFAISIPIIFIVIIYNFSYYNNTIRVNVQFIDRFFGEPKDKFDNNINQDDKRDLGLTINDMDGVYSITIENGEIIQVSDNVTEELKEYARKISSKDSESGIIGNYIYKKRNRDMQDKETTIILIESSNEINKIKLVNILSL